MRSAAPSGLSARLRAIDASLKRDDSIDVRDTGRSDQVFHAVGSYLAGLGDRRLDRSSSESIPGPAVPLGGGDVVAPGRARGCGRPVLQSGRRRLIYGIASAATCAPPGCWTVRRRSSVVPPTISRSPRGEDVGRWRRGRSSESAGPCSGIEPGGFRPVIWRRLDETAQGECARGRQHSGVRGVQQQWSVHCTQQRRRRKSPARVSRPPRRVSVKLGVTLPLSGSAAGRRPADPEGRPACGRPGQRQGRHRRLQHQGRPARPRRQRPVQRAAGRCGHADLCR